jgi:HEAT repeat protein
LIERHCQDAASRGRAALSLVYLGVPAKTVLQKAAIEGKEAIRYACVGALGEVGGSATVELLCRLVRDPVLSANLRDRAAWSLKDLADPNAGPALLEALQLEPPRSSVVWALQGIRYRLAGPKLQELLMASQNEWFRAEAAEALAAMRYREAVPAIQAFAREPRNDSGITARAEKALLLLTGKWGEPTEHIRLLLQLPRRAVFGDPVRMGLYIENVSREMLYAPAYREGTLIINGRRREHALSGPGGAAVFCWG